MLKNPINNLEELQKNSEQLLLDALENQIITIRRLGVKVADFSEIKGQRDITNYF
jgi:DNA polymerase IV (DinB-like DNA polymerase)